MDPIACFKRFCEAICDYDYDEMMSAIDDMRTWCRKHGDLPLEIPIRSEGWKNLWTMFQKVGVQQEPDEEEVKTYRIVRKFFDKHPDEEIATGLTLDEAKAHCGNPETSSTSCTTASAKAITEKMGPWFDAYYEE